jgi:hypothetical protein
MMYSEKKCIELEKKLDDLENKYITLENKNNDLEFSNLLDYFIKPVYFIYHISYLSEYSERKRDKYIEYLAFTTIFLFNLCIYKNAFLLSLDFIRYFYNKFNNVIIINLNINNYKLI